MKCMNCGKDIDSDKKFCNRSCAATYNNRMFPKRRKHESRYCKCGNIKDARASMCRVCMKNKNAKEAMNRTIGEMLNKGNARVKYASIRTWAARLMSEIYKADKKCEACGFDVVVEVCHIKPLSEFSENELMGVANARENLKYLCPNHHAMFDKGLLKI